MGHHRVRAPGVLPGDSPTVRIRRVAPIAAGVTLACAIVARLAFDLTRILVGPVPARPFLVGFLVLAGLALYSTFAPRAPFFGAVYGRGRPRTPAVALTFDDGPNEPYTSQVLDILAAWRVRATFFVLGANAVRYPATLKRQADEGHEIGNHTHNHRVLPLTGPRYLRNQIRTTSDMVERITGRRPRLFRAPHGWRNPWTTFCARREGCATVAWTVGVYDTARPGAAAIVDRTLRRLEPGAILLLHDGRGLEDRPDAGQVVEALPMILQEGIRRGYRFLTVSELMEEAAARSRDSGPTSTSSELRRPPPS